jgi:hypothetical protein
MWVLSLPTTWQLLCTLLMMAVQVLMVLVMKDCGFSHKLLAIRRVCGHVQAMCRACAGHVQGMAAPSSSGWSKCRPRPQPACLHVPTCSSQPVHQARLIKGLHQEEAWTTYPGPACACLPRLLCLGCLLLPLWRTGTTCCCCCRPRPLLPPLQLQASKALQQATHAATVQHRSDCVKRVNHADVRLLGYVLLHRLQPRAEGRLGCTALHQLV